ncbi:MAG TPA: hypothetical protein VGS79_03000 [Puia sp.]|nr:hypothetical protein [Puia sp.]
MLSISQPARAIAVGTLCLIAIHHQAQAQTLPAAAPATDRILAQDLNYVAPGHELSEQLFFFNWDILMNPIYFSQISGPFRLNGVAKDYSPRPKFYALVPGQNPLIGSAITDEAGCYYASWRICFFDHLSKKNFFHNMRLITGITHDKLEAPASGTVFYKYTNGGTELTCMLDKNLSPSLTHFNYDRLRLIFNWNAQAGVFAALAKIQDTIRSGGDTLIAANDNRFQLPDPRSGWGAIVASNLEVGVPLSFNYSSQSKGFLRHIALVIGCRFMAEYLHSGTDVTKNGLPGYHLTQNMFTFAFCGPILGLKIISKL